jgi:hypothetical protein
VRGERVDTEEMDRLRVVAPIADSEVPPDGDDEVACWYQSIASSSSMRLTMARCRSRVEGLSESSDS